MTERVRNVVASGSLHAREILASLVSYSAMHRRASSTLESRAFEHISGISICTEVKLLRFDEIRRGGSTETSIRQVKAGSEETDCERVSVRESKVVSFVQQEANMATPLEISYRTLSDYLRYPLLPALSYVSVCAESVPSMFQSYWERLTLPATQHANKKRLRLGAQILYLTIFSRFIDR